MRRDAWFNRIWYEGEPAPWRLGALALLYRGATALRRLLYRTGILRRERLSVPVIVIGNLTAGGTGKTPLAIALVRELQRKGFSPGIVSRGYGGKAGRQPLKVTSETSPQRAGDEPLMLARRSGVPVYVHPRRARAGKVMLAEAKVNVIVCDDGLQHYALARDVEIAVVDAMRGLGNGRLLPAGPLREPLRRLATVEHVVINGEGDAPGLPATVAARAQRMQLRPVALVNVQSGERVDPAALAGRKCAALAGIGNPQRFFSTLAELGYSATCRAFPDHHAYRESDFAFAAGLPLLMTEKDAVKCRHFAESGAWWYLEIVAQLDAAFVDGLLSHLHAPA